MQKKKYDEDKDRSWSLSFYTEQCEECDVSPLSAINITHLAYNTVDDADAASISDSASDCPMLIGSDTDSVSDSASDCPSLIGSDKSESDYDNVSICSDDPDDLRCPNWCPGIDADYEYDEEDASAVGEYYDCIEEQCVITEVFDIKGCSYYAPTSEVQVPSINAACIT